LLEHRRCRKLFPLLRRKPAFWHRGQPDICIKAHLMRGMPRQASGLPAAGRCRRPAGPANRPSPRPRATAVRPAQSNRDDPSAGCAKAASPARSRHRRGWRCRRQDTLGIKSNRTCGSTAGSLAAPNICLAGWPVSAACAGHLPGAQIRSRTIRPNVRTAAECIACELAKTCSAHALAPIDRRDAPDAQITCQQSSLMPRQGKPGSPHAQTGPRTPSGHDPVQLQRC
jgi:hypothetical protein